MRNLAFYKGAEVRLRQSYRQAKTPEYKLELAKAIHYIARKIEQIERQVLVH